MNDNLRSLIWEAGLVSRLSERHSDSNGRRISLRATLSRLRKGRLRDPPLLGASTPIGRPSRSPLNRFLHRAVLLCVSAIAVCGCGGPSVAAHPADSAALDDDIQSKIARALAGDWRGAEARQRDVYRHPKETLAFFGLKDDLHVVEISPGFGWYTAILAPVLAPRGRLTVTS